MMNPVLCSLVLCALAVPASIAQVTFQLATRARCGVYADAGGPGPTSQTFLNRAILHTGYWGIQNVGAGSKASAYMTITPNYTAANPGVDIHFKGTVSSTATPTVAGSCGSQGSLGVLPFSFQFISSRSMRAHLRLELVGSILHADPSAIQVRFSQWAPAVTTKGPFRLVKQYSFPLYPGFTRSVPLPASARRVSKPVRPAARGHQ